MSKSIKVLSIFLILFSLTLSFYNVNASDIDMNLVSNEDVSNDVIDDNTTMQSTTDQTQLSSDSDTITSPSILGSSSENVLGFSNILNILLIAVGIVIILLSIAILTRLK